MDGNIMVDAADTFFSFTVVEGMQPGDVLRARTPTGCLLELTVPKGALVGDIVQFALPDPNEEPHVVPTPRGNTQPAVPAKFKATARVNVRDVDEHGLTNAKPKGIFCVKLPSRITGGESIVVDLPHGERVTVTVPPRAKAGRELKFCAGVGGEPASIVAVRIKGFIKLRSSQRIKGLHKWQVRWFELTPLRLSYWEVASDGTAEARGAFPFLDVIGVRNHTRSAHRIELRLRTGRTVHLCAPSAGDGKAWLGALQLVLLDCAAQRASPADPLCGIEAQCTGSVGVQPSVGLRSTGRTSIVKAHETRDKRRSDVSQGPGSPAPSRACKPDSPAPSPACKPSEASRHVQEKGALDAEGELPLKSSSDENVDEVGPEACDSEREACNLEDEAGEHRPEDPEESEEAEAAAAELEDEMAGEREEQQSGLSRSTRGSTSLSKSDSSGSSPGASPMHGSSPSSLDDFRSASAVPSAAEPQAHLCRATSRACVLFPELPGSREVELQALGVAAFMSRIERSRKAAACRHESAVAAAA